MCTKVAVKHQSSHTRTHAHTHTYRHHTWIDTDSGHDKYKSIVELSASSSNSGSSAGEPPHPLIYDGKHVMPNSIDPDKLDPHIKHDKGDITLEELMEKVNSDMISLKHDNELYQRPYCIKIYL